MARAQGTVVSRHLPWLFVQAAIFLPAVLGPDFWEVADRSLAVTVLEVLLAVWLGYCIVRNLRLLLAAPARETFRTHVVLLAGAGLLLGLLSAGRLTEGPPDSRPVAAIAAAIGVVLLALAVREVRRLRSVGRVGLEPTTQGL